MTARSVLRTGTLVIAAVLIVLAGRLIQLQIANGQTYRAYADGNRLKRELLPAPRGTIVDRNGESMADNVPAFSVELRPRDLPRGADERTARIARIADAVRMSTPDVQSALYTKATEWVVLKTDVPEEDALRIGGLLTDLPEVSVIARPSRRYRDPAYAPITGYIGRVTEADLATLRPLDPGASVGRAGIESQYESILQGHDGQRVIERDSKSRELGVLGERAAVAGDQLTLTVDAGLQRAAAQALQRGVARVGSSAGALVALDPRSGAVLALATTPSYNPEALAHGLSAVDAQALFHDPRFPFLNRAIAGEFPSGSTIKPVIAATALDRGIITSRTTVNSVGGITVGGDSFPDWKPGGHGSTNAIKALADSVNTFFYYIGGGYGDFQGLGLQRLIDGFTAFGLGTPTGIDLPGEQAGILPTAAVRAARGTPWYLGDTYHLSIGQGPFAVTPLQLANATAAVANGGTLWKPYLVQTATAADGEKRTVNEPTALRTGVATLTSLATVQAGMRQAVTDGSARAIGDLPLPFAAKTGTAQFGDGSRTHAWFTVFGPTDQPEIVVTVLVEAGGEGHAAALPIAKEVLRWWVDHRHA